MKPSLKFAGMMLSACAGLALSEGCMLSNFIHRDNEMHEYTSTGQPIKRVKKSSWLDKLNLDNLRDPRAVEVDRHMSSGF